MSFNFVAGKPAHPIALHPIMSGNFIGDIDGDGADLINVSHISQTNADEGRLVFFDSTTSGLANDERNIRGHSALSFKRATNVFTVNSGMVHNRNEIATNYTASVSDYYIGCNHTASITITLPQASALSSGQTFTIKDESGTANTFSVNIVGQGSDKIDGQENIVIESPYGAINLYSNGSNKYFIF